MPDQTQRPGPGRATADDSFAERKKEIARRNDAVQKEARVLRTAREQEQVRRRRKEDLR